LPVETHAVTEVTAGIYSKGKGKLSSIRGNLNGTNQKLERGQKLGKKPL